MKRTIVLTVLSGVWFAFGLVSCGGGGGSNDGSNDTSMSCSDKCAAECWSGDAICIDTCYAFCRDDATSSSVNQDTLDTADDLEASKKCEEELGIDEVPVLSARYQNIKDTCQSPERDSSMEDDVQYGFE